MLTLRLIPLALSTVTVLAACSSAASPPTASPTPTVAPSLGIDHPTGATDVVLRMSTGGGFLAPGALATEVPEFSLYGDGTVVFRDPTAAPPAPVPDDGIFRGAPFKTARLSESQMQDLLAFAIGPGGLGIARDEYTPGGIADAPSTTFTLQADGRQKTVTVGALDFDQPQPGPDSAARTAFRQLAAHLRKLDQNEIEAGPYAPAAYRGILADGAGGVIGAPARAWPWTFGPDSFKAPPDPNGFANQTRTLTAEDVAALKVDGISGGAQSIALRTDDGKVFVLSVRPLLPDEES
jgi:hypothetical protein